MRYFIANWKMYPTVDEALALLGSSRTASVSGPGSASLAAEGLLAMVDRLGTQPAPEA